MTRDAEIRISTRGLAWREAVVVRSLLSVLPKPDRRSWVVSDDDADVLVLDPSTSDGREAHDFQCGDKPAIVICRGAMRLGDREFALPFPITLPRLRGALDVAVESLNQSPPVDQKTHQFGSLSELCEWLKGALRTLHPPPQILISVASWNFKIYPNERACISLSSPQILRSLRHPDLVQCSARVLQTAPTGDSGNRCPMDELLWCLGLSNGTLLPWLDWSNNWYVDRTPDVEIADREVALVVAALCRKHCSASELTRRFQVGEDSIAGVLNALELCGCLEPELISTELPAKQSASSVGLSLLARLRARLGISALHSA